MAHRESIKNIKVKSAKKQGRPTTYTKEIGIKICEAIANSNKGLTHICKENPDFPGRQAIHEWVIKYKDFGDNYTRARELQAELLIDEILDIADYGLNDTYIDSNGNVKTNNDVIQRSRLRVDTRKWLASKLVPKIYGDKIQTQLMGKDEKPLAEIPISVQIINDQISQILGKKDNGREDEGDDREIL